jgi:copper chaperone
MGILMKRMRETMMNTTKYQVTGMTCGHCEVAIRAEVGQIGGVEHIEVSSASGKLVITSAVALDESAVLGAVDEAGYSAVRVA